MVVFNYNPISAVNYDKLNKLKENYSSDSDVSSYESRGSTPELQSGEVKASFSQFFEHSSSNSNEDDDEDEIDNIWADKSPEYTAATPAFVKTQPNSELPAMLEIAGITAKAAVPPVHFNPEQLARLELHKRSTRCSSCSSDEDVDAEGDNVKRGKNESVRDSNESSTSKSENNSAEGAIGNNIAGDNTEVYSNLDNSFSTSETPEPQFSRSSVGGSKFISNCHPYNPDEYDGLEFESRFESGNLAKAVRITPTYYELYIRPDLYTSRSKQWFYFRVRNTRSNITYRFSIVNLVKSDSLYNDGMRPLMYSAINAKERDEGWKRCGVNICYYRNDDENANEEEEDQSTYTLTFNIEFPHNNDTVYFAHSYPYTYSDLQDYLMAIQKNPAKSKFCKLRLLCRSLAGNNVYYLTVTAPTADEEAMKRKKSIVVSARVHPSETPSSWMMKGLMDFITSECTVAKRLRHKFIFKLIPMLNPDGVIVGNTRNSLTGKDLNRQYRTVIRETYPSIWYTKAMIKRLIDECGVTMYCDMHAHSRKHNIFVYGCENKRNPEKKLTEQVFPLMMHKNVADKFSFEGCKFKVQRSKEGTGRIVMWLLGITNSYTIEASFGGSSLGSRKNTHFNTLDYEHIGRAFCETLLDYCDENPIKVKKQNKLLKQVKKIRKHEKKEREILKLKKLAEQERLRLKIIERLLREGSSADEPLNIPLTDYSSDEGHTSSSSDNEGNTNHIFSDLEGPCCQPLRVPPCSPEINSEIRKFKYKRMRKIMSELDRIYFQPLLKKRLRSVLHIRRVKHRREKRTTRASIQTKEREKAAHDSDEGAAKAPSGKQEPTTDSGSEATFSTVDEASVNLTGPLTQSFTSDSLDIISQQSQQSESSLQGQPIQTLIKKVPNRTKTRKKKRKHGLVETLQATEPKTRIRVSRKMRLWLQLRRIIIFRRRKVNRKLKFRSKSSNAQRKKLDAQRVLLDLPTTDPGSDIHFSTDEELFLESAPPGTDSSFSNIMRTRRSLLHSELQRRYIEEIGDGVNLFNCMPPELIVTSPTKQTKGSSASTHRYTSKPKTAPEKLVAMDFPSIVENARRINSLNNLNFQNPKGQSRSSMHNTFQLHSSIDGKSKDDLQFVLSLKKKVWTGTQLDPSNKLDSNRPLSWGIPPLASQTKKERSSFNFYQNQRDETEALFTACSQKLIAWQQTNLPQPKNKMTFNMMTSETKAEDQSLRLLRQMPPIRKPQKSQVNYNQRLETIEEKFRKRKNPAIKTADTTDLATHVAKRKSQYTSKTRHIKTTTSSISMKSTSTNKFKTGGIVVTAVQTTAKKKIRKIRLNPSIYSANKTDVVLNNDATTPQSEPRATSQVINDNVRLETALQTSHMVRKVKTKLKKKKSSSGIHSSEKNLPPVASASTAGPGSATRLIGVIGGGVIKKNYSQ